MSKVKFTIGVAAKHTGLSAHTLRYYEKIGLLSQINKDASGKRIFSLSNIQRIEFIKRAQTMQFSLDDIKKLITLDQYSATPKPEAQSMVKNKLSLIEERLNDLQELKENLSQLLLACEASSEKEKCPILEDMKIK